MTTVELIYKKEFVSRNDEKLFYSDFVSGNEFSIYFTEKKNILYIYDSINDEPEELFLDKYSYFIINHYNHFSISEVIERYKEYVNSKQILDSSLNFKIHYNEKMSLEKLINSLNDNWRYQIIKDLFGDLKVIENVSHDENRQNTDSNKSNQNNQEQNVVKNNIDKDANKNITNNNSKEVKKND